MSEIVENPTSAFVVKAQDDEADTIYAAAQTLEAAAALAGAFFVASTAVQYRPHLQIFETATGDLVGFIGQYREETT